MIDRLKKSIREEGYRQLVGGKKVQISYHRCFFFPSRDTSQTGMWENATAGYGMEWNREYFKEIWEKNTLALGTKPGMNSILPFYMLSALSFFFRNYKPHTSNCI